MNFIPHAYQQYSVDYIIDHPTAALFLGKDISDRVERVAIENY